MKPGRSLDALVAEHIMGWKWMLYPKDQKWAQIYLNEGKTGYWMAGTCTINTTNSDNTPNCPRYSTDIHDAWKVVEAVKCKTPWDGFSFYLVWGPYGKDMTPKGAHGQIIYPREMSWLCKVETLKNTYSIVSDTAPHAICLAALKTIGYNLE